MNVPEIVADGEETSFRYSGSPSRQSKSQSFRGFLDKTRNTFRSPSPGKRQEKPGEAKNAALINSFTWNEKIPSQQKINDLATKILWVEKAQRVFSVEQKYTRPTTPKETSVEMFSPRQFLDPSSHSDRPLSFSPVSPGNDAYLKRHSNRFSSCQETFDFEEFGASLETSDVSRETTRGGTSSSAPLTGSRDSQTTAVDQEPDYSLILTEVTTLQQNGQLEQAHNLMAKSVPRSIPDTDTRDPADITPLLTLNLMYGLSLRHGWGNEKDEAQAFQRICGAGIGLCQVSWNLLKEFNSPRDPKATIFYRSALKTAISGLAQCLYELGHCYNYGWGLAGSSEVAQIYYECGAWLGDEDAQEQRGRLLSKSKKFEEKKVGANWLRVAQKKEGHSTAGDSWVWKDKYDEHVV